MKVLTYNVLCFGCEGHSWQERKDAVTSTVRKADPDVFGLQEAHFDWMKIFFKAFPDYDYVGVGRNDGKEDGEFSPVFYKKDKFELLDKGWFWISETPDVPSESWNTCCIRICTYAKLKEKSTGKVFIAMNTHLDHRSELARSEGIKLINKVAKKFDCPAVLTGDFNVSEKTDCYIDMIDIGLFKDAKFVADKTESEYTFHPYFHHDGPNDIIDFIFVTDGFEVCSYHVITDKVDGAFPSDHCPVIAELK